VENAWGRRGGEIPGVWELALQIKMVALEPCDLQVLVKCQLLVMRLNESTLGSRAKFGKKSLGKTGAERVYVHGGKWYA